MENRENEIIHSIFEQQPQSLEKKIKGTNWSVDETKHFLSLCKEHKIVELMDGKRHKHLDIYRSIEPKMRECGYPKTAAQMQIKMKHLKETYYRCKRNNKMSGAAAASFCFYLEMDDIYGTRPSSEAIAGVGVDSSDRSNASTMEEAIEVEYMFDGSADETITQSECTPSKKAKKGGRSTHVKLAENFADVFAAKHAEAMKSVLSEQMDRFNEVVKTQMVEQKKWEEEMLSKEHAQNSQLMEKFLSGMREMQMSNMQSHQYQPPSCTMHTFASPPTANNFQPLHIALSPSSSGSSTNIVTSPFRSVNLPQHIPPSPSSSGSSANIVTSPFRSVNLPQHIPPSPSSSGSSANIVTSPFRSVNLPQHIPPSPSSSGSSTNIVTSPFRSVNLPQHIPPSPSSSGSSTNIVISPFRSVNLPQHIPPSPSSSGSSTNIVTSPFRSVNLPQHISPSPSSSGSSTKIVTSPVSSVNLPQSGIVILSPVKRKLKLGKENKGTPN